TTSWAMRPVLARSGSEALDACTRAAGTGDPFRLAILDQRMPDLEGPVVARRIASSGECGRPAVIVLSSAGDPVPPGELIGTGVVSVLSKPVRQADLLDAVLNALAGTSGADLPGTS